MFKCKVCAEKDKSLARLADEVTFLRNLVHPKVDNSYIPENNLEANGILDVIDQPIQVQTYASATLEEAEEAARERDNILSGNY